MIDVSKFKLSESAVFEISRLLSEKKRRQASIDNMMSDSFEAQQRFIQDPARLKAALTTRRAGKSLGAALYYFLEQRRVPKCNLLYTALTRDSAERILKKDCIDYLADKYKVLIRYNANKGYVHFLESGSYLYLLGMDASKKEMEKVLGNKFLLVLIDESASYNIDLGRLVYQVLKPCVADLNGTIGMIGTPGNNVYSFFFKVTTEQEKGWSVHQWSALDNPYMREAWEREIRELVEKNPDIVKTTWFKQMFLGRWVIDDDKLVYKYKPEINRIDSLPFTKHWYNVLGIDLGFDDASSFSIIGYRDNDASSYIRKSYKRSGMTLTDVAEYTNYLIKEFSPYEIVIDNADKQSVEELKQRFGLPLTAANKSAKADFIHIMNDDFRQGKIKILAKECEPLIKEYETLVWDEGYLERGKFFEKASCENHCADGSLYGWRRCYNYLERQISETPKTEEERMEEDEEMEDDKAFWER